MGACADYSVDSDDMMVKTSNAGNGTRDIAYYALPADYNLDTYLKLNPDVKYYQIINMLRIRDNKPRLDSMQNEETKADATARYDADNEAFLADEALAKKAFLMAGYPESMWSGAADLDKEQKSVILRYNKQQIGGAPNAAQDLDYINNFQYDSELYDMHYAVFGIPEGRPYRVCAAADITIPAGRPQAGKTVVPKEQAVDKSLASIVNLADTLGAKPRMMDYSAFYFCKNEKDGFTYPIWNEAGGDRLVRIREVKDSLLVAEPEEPASSESADNKELSSSSENSMGESSSDASGEGSSSSGGTEETSSSSEETSSESSAESSSSEIPAN